ncbi:MAG: hypothetical protein KJ690_09610 [Alphaproteobacteria bacterium]|nr:hypothetical protein [Alphaproteobacteria bacterium]
MTVTYPADHTKPYGDRLEVPNLQATHRTESVSDEPFVPVYARRGKARGGQGKIKTWMILAPVAVLVLGGIGAMLVMGGGEEASVPLAEPAATAPVLPAVATDTAAAPLTTAATPAPAIVAPAAAAPVRREAAPMRRTAPTPAPARREAVRPTSAAASSRTVTPAPTATGPRAYAPAATPSTTTLNTAPAARPAATPTPTPTAPPPVIIIEPAG